jgi:hypothetical protein
VPLLACVVSAVFAVLVFSQWLQRRRSFQLVWTIGLVWYALSTGTEFAGASFGWNGALYRMWYVSGAVLVAAFLGSGTVYLLRRTGFGYFAAFSVLLGGLFSLLASSKYEGAATSSLLAFLGALVAAVALVVVTARWRELTGHVFLALLAIGAIVVGGAVLSTPIAQPGFALDPSTHVPVPSGMPGAIRVLTFPFNAGGGLCLVFGAIFSVYVYMPKRRVLRANLNTPVVAQLYAALVIVVNLIASVPAAAVALGQNRLNSRVPATLLIAIGASVTGITSGLERFGITWSAYVWQLVGIVLIFLGFLVTEEVFQLRRRSLRLEPT